MNAPLSVSGELGDIDSGLLIASFCRTRETGALQVSGDSGLRTLFLRNGEIVFAASTDPDDGLGAHVVRSGRIGLGDLDRVYPLVTPERRLGSVLVAERLIGPEELVTVVTDQLRGIVESVLLAVRGRYRFEFRETPLKEMIVLRADSRALLLGGLRRVSSVTRVRRGLRQREAGPWQALPQESWAVLEPASPESRVLEEFLKPRDATFLPALADESGFSVARATWALGVVGALARIEARAATPAPGSLGPASAGSQLPEAQEQALGASLRETVLAFNERQRALCRLLRIEMGSGAEIFLRGSLTSLASEAQKLLAGLTYGADGRWDGEELTRRLSRLDAERARRLLSEVVAAQVGEIERCFDGERAEELRQAISEPGDGDGPTASV